MSIPLKYIRESVKNRLKAEKRLHFRPWFSYILNLRKTLFQREPYLQFLIKLYNIEMNEDIHLREKDRNFIKELLEELVEFRGGSSSCL